MFILVYKERGVQARRRFGAVAGLGLAVVGLASAQASFTNPLLYDNSTASAEFAARGSLELNPPTRSNVLILGQSNELAAEPVRATSPWAGILGQPQAFELNYNVDTGDISWNLLGVTLTANQLLAPGRGLYYLAPLVKVQTPASAAVDNFAKLSDVTIDVNGGGGTNFGNWQKSGNGFDSGVIYFTQYDIHTVKVTGNLTFDIPSTWSDEINGTYADLELVSAAPVPEPATMAVLGIGIAAAIRRRKKA